MATATRERPTRRAASGGFKASVSQRWQGFLKKGREAAAEPPGEPMIPPLRDVASRNARDAAPTLSGSTVRRRAAMATIDRTNTKLTVTAGSDRFAVALPILGTIWLPGVPPSVTPDTVPPV